MQGYSKQWGMTSLKFRIPFLEMEFKPQDADRIAAWKLYIELSTRISTQQLDDNHGDEKRALASASLILAITRDVIKNNGRDCIEFTKIAFVILNQIVGPFTAKWDRLSENGAFDDSAQCQRFRSELATMQGILKEYTKMLANMAGVGYLTELENNEI